MTKNIGYNAGEEVDLQTGINMMILILGRNRALSEQSLRDECSAALGFKISYQSFQRVISEAKRLNLIDEASRNVNSTQGGYSYRSVIFTKSDHIVDTVSNPVCPTADMS